MIATRTLISLVNAAFSGDTNRVYNVAMQMAATMAREGNGFGAKELANALDKARMKGALPSFSGHTANCPKCNNNGGWETVKAVRVKYVRENEREFLERLCSDCGYTWYERCADARESNDVPVD